MESAFSFGNRLLKYFDKKQPAKKKDQKGPKDFMEIVILLQEIQTLRFILIRLKHILIF